MGLVESPHCPFDVMEACRTGVRRDSHQPWLTMTRRRNQQATGPGDGGAAEEMDQDGGPTDNDWKTMTKGQKRNWKQQTAGTGT